MPMKPSGSDSSSPSSPHRPPEVGPLPTPFAASPMVRPLSIGCARILLILVCIAYVDRPAATWSHDYLQRPTLAITMSRLSEPFVPISVAILVVAGVAALAGQRVRSGIAQNCCLAALATVAASETRTALKLVFGRTWPDTFVDHNPSWIQNHVFGFSPFHGGAGWSAFPSGHTAVITAAVSVFWMRLPQFRPLYAACLAIEVLGLYGADYHFVSDMLAGAMVGVVSARAVLASCNVSLKSSQ